MTLGRKPRAPLGAPPAVAGEVIDLPQ